MLRVNRIGNRHFGLTHSSVIVQVDAELSVMEAEQARDDSLKPLEEKPVLNDEALRKTSGVDKMTASATSFRLRQCTENERLRT